jgi:hypothetical protein
VPGVREARGDLKAQVARQSRGYENPVRFYVDKIVEGRGHDRLRRSGPRR